MSVLLVLARSWNVRTHLHWGRNSLVQVNLLPIVEATRRADRGRRAKRVQRRREHSTQEGGFCPRYAERFQRDAEGVYSARICEDRARSERREQELDAPCFRSWLASSVLPFFALFGEFCFGEEISSILAVIGWSSSFTSSRISDHEKEDTCLNDSSELRLDQTVAVSR